MRFHVRHITRFHYSRPVFLEPLTIRLRPRNDFRQRLIDFHLEINPASAQLFESIDLEGNHIDCAVFRELTSDLTITTRFVAETGDINPFGYLIAPDATKLPLSAPNAEQAAFEFYVRQTNVAPEIRELAQRLAAESDFQTIEFLTTLNSWIHDNHEKIQRPHGPPWESLQTLNKGQGSCRDLTVLFMACCRVMNIPSRFVSGYSSATKDEGEERHLHAWAEVYLPGAGWRAFDPSLGLAITDSHLAVAAAADSVNAAPTGGTFRGAAESRLEAEIELETSVTAAALR